jgi:hypothetical protein
MRFKTWLRAGGEVEIIGPDGWYWRSGHWQQRAERSVMAELLAETLTPQEIRALEIGPGVWLLPGPPP